MEFGDSFHPSRIILESFESCPVLFPERLKAFEDLHGTLGFFHAAVFQSCFRLGFQFIRLIAIQGLFLLWSLRASDWRSDWAVASGARRNAARSMILCSICLDGLVYQEDF
jgi:hypothetical protein